MLENAGNFAAQSENPNVWKQYAWPGDDCPHFYGLNFSSLFYTRFLEITETVGEGNPWSHQCPSPLPPPGFLSISACRNIQKEGSITYMLQYVGKQRWIERRIGCIWFWDWGRQYCRDVSGDPVWDNILSDKVHICTAKKYKETWQVVSCASPFHLLGKVQIHPTQSQSFSPPPGGVLPYL